MSKYFNAYVQNMNRVRFAELVDYHMLRDRNAQFKASLVVNPVTGLPYDSAQESSAGANAEPVAFAACGRSV